MMPMTRQEIEALLDSPEQQDYVVSAYVDMTVKNGFTRDVDLHLRNQARAAAETLAQTRARKDLETNIEVIRQIVSERAGTPAQGLAIFSSLSRGSRHVFPLDFEVENRLVIDEEPFLLPLLERFYAEPAYLLVLLDSDQARLFSAHHGHPEWVRDLERREAEEAYQRDKPRFTYKKRFARAQHERLHSTDEDRFLHEVCEVVARQWARDHFAGLILLGQPPITASLRRLLPRELGQAVAGEAPHAMTTRPDDLSDDVERILEKWRIGREQTLMTELRERWKRGHLVANGPTEVLDALQQGRAVHIVFGTRRDAPGARCGECGYRFGSPMDVCPYCRGACKTLNAAQEIFRMAIRHRIPVHLLRSALKDDPLAPAGGVAALLRAESNWAKPPAPAGDGA
jgi:peptide chain release factor subunit 1